MEQFSPKQMLIESMQTEIAESLSMWQDILLHADADEWAYELNYTEKDLLNALYIFSHIATNKAIKSGFINETNAATVGAQFKHECLKAFGFDSVELTNKVLNINNGTDTTSEIPQE